ncbi:MAG TPA: Crp/Fnr family transcriptional regulator [Bryobacteraceae bacterium]|nr:Crp/Fnr family transcriptional regulator [Bryobacteraceae bacterium]HPQ15404.1 Crp/Fnr family transcriptional regulator [Bryobacteraceae bacterium]HPU72257.1 Crp/Fnr family transcriptional regulator [Bryobacteraceae bacterium]
MSAPQKMETFRRVPLFAGLTEEELASLARRAVEKRYSAGEVLFYEGEPCTGFFLIGQGSVKIYKTSGSGREIMLAIDTAPSSVAEVPLFDGGPYPATVSAVNDVVAYVVSKQDFHAVCLQNPNLPLKVLAVVGRRLRHLVRIVESVTFGSVRQRLASALLEFGNQAGSDVFSLPVTHEELALRLGTVREVVSRNLSRFQAEGLLRVQRREIHLLDREGLLREAETEL